MKPNAMARANKMVAIIRGERTVRFGDLCARMNMAPATLYGYAKILTNAFTDIKFEDGLFYCNADEKLEELTSQKRLTNQ